MKEKSIIKTLIVILVVVFLVHQAYSSFYSPIKTENAEYYVADEGINAYAMVIRQEKVIVSNGSGALHFRLSNGNRISRNGVLADVYGDNSASLTVSKIDDINRKISDIEEVSGYNDTSATDISLVNLAVSDSLNDFVFNCSANNFAQNEDREQKMLLSFNKKLFLTGDNVDFSAKLNELKSELEALKAQLPAPVGSVIADMSGYFVSAVDGYESRLQTETIDDLTPEVLSKIKPDKVPQNAVGKIVSDYDWYLAIEVSIGESAKYTAGDELLVKTNVRNNDELKVTVKQINLSSKSDKAVLVLSCKEMNKELAEMRSGPVTIISKEYKGLKLSKKALRVVNGKTGVYVVSGLTLKFVTVDIIYNTDDYIICKQNNIDDKTALRLYDEVVVKGKNLYEGKVIN